MLKTLVVDDKWKLVYDPDMNDSVQKVLRYDTLHRPATEGFDNLHNALHHALLEAHARIAELEPTDVAAQHDIMLQRLRVAAVVKGGLIMNCETQPCDGFSVTIPEHFTEHAGTYCFTDDVDIESALYSILHFEEEPA